MTVNQKIFELPLNDYLQISNLNRIDIDPDLIASLQPGFLDRLLINNCQVYIIRNTIYGCIIEWDEILKHYIYIWFGYFTNQANKLVMQSNTNLYDIISLCEPLAIESLLYNLDILRG